MNTHNIAAFVTFISALFTLGGVSGVTATDVSGFVNVIFALVSLVGVVVMHFSHKHAVAGS